MKDFIRRKQYAAASVICFVIMLCIWKAACLPVQAQEIPAEKETDIIIDKSHFPDDWFRYYIRKNLDKNGDEILSKEELKNITKISYISGLKSLEGIKYFAYLEELSLGSDITDLDVSGMAALEKITCELGNLTNLNVRNCISLKELNCNNNYLSTLDLSTNTALTILDISENSIKSLDIRNCKALKKLLINQDETWSEDLTLDLSNNTALTELSVSGAYGTRTIDLKNNTALEKLDISNARIDVLNIKSCTKLKELYCMNRDMEELDVSCFPSLEVLVCGGNKFSTLDLNNCKHLKGLYCNWNYNLTTIKLDKCTELTTLHCYETGVSSLDLSNCTLLKELECFDCFFLSSLDLSNCTSLKALRCENCSLTSLDLSDCRSLKKYQNNINQASSQIDAVGSKIDLGPGFKKDRVSRLHSGTAQNRYITWKSPDQIPGRITYRYATGYKNTYIIVTIDITNGNSKLINHKVTFDKNGGTNLSRKSKTVIYGNYYGSLPKVTKKGRKFDGWYTKKTGGTKVTEFSIVYTMRDHTLYAHWRNLNTYEITFETNGGTGLSKSRMIVTYNKPYGSLPTVRRKGYRFAGWYCERVSTARITDKTIVNMKKDHILTAEWKESPTCKVTFHENAGDKLENNSKTVTYKESYGSMPKVQRKGYTFLGWYSKKNGGRKITEDTNVTTTKTHNLYAHWKKVTKPYRTSITKLNSKKPGQLNVIYRKVRNATGYEIIYSTDRRFKSYSKKATTVVSKTLKGLKKGKSYYVKVRAFTTDSTGKRFYGSWSGYKKITISR